MRTAGSFARVWPEVWRVALALALGALFWSGLVVFAPERGGASRDWLLYGDPAVALLAAGLLPFRRRWPLPVALATASCAAVSVISVGLAGIALISLATHRRWGHSLVGGAAFVVAGMVYDRLLASDDSSTAANLLTLVLAVAAAIALGSYLGARRDNLASLREQVATAERDQARRVDQARATERSRIAREMHDVLAHRISLIAMHAGALAYREDLPRDQVREIATLLRDNADEAVTELREVLGVLRSANEPVQPLAPQPDLRRLDDLVREAQGAGSTVHVQCDVDVAALPETVSRHAYRVIQESLTNARKHAPGMPVTVTVSGRVHQGLEVSVLNPPAPYGSVSGSPGGSGLGLLGLTERMSLAGGRFSYGTDRAGRFVVQAWAPWESDGRG